MCAMARTRPNDLHPYIAIASLATLLLIIAADSEGPILQTIRQLMRFRVEGVP